MSNFRSWLVSFFENAGNEAGLNNLVKKDSLMNVTLKQIEESWAFWINATKSEIEDAFERVDANDGKKLR